MARGRLRLALLLAALLCVVLTPAVAGARAVPNNFVGVNVDGPLYPSQAQGVDLSQQFGLMESSGVEAIRVVFDWSYAQPYPNWRRVPPAQFTQFVDEGGVPTRFTQMDRIVAFAARRGISILPTVIYAPGWDNIRHDNTTFGRPKRTAPYAAFLTALIQRYGPRGAFWNFAYTPPDPIREWQIWNEPNIPFFWPTQPFAKTYEPLVAAAHAAIKRADRGAKVVLAGFPNYSWTSMAHYYAIKGARKTFDIAAVHPFTAKPSGVVTILQKVRKVMNQHGDRRKPLIADEVSWTSSKGQTTHNVHVDVATTEKGQAKNIGTLLPMLARDRRKLGLGAFYYYTWAGVEGHNYLTFAFAGLLKYVKGALSEKPAFNAFQNAALNMERCYRKGAFATQCVQPF